MIRLFRSDLPKPAPWPRDSQSIAAALRWTRLHDPYGHQIHNGLAIIYMLLLPWITAPKDVAFVLLVGYAVFRIPFTWRCYAPLIRSPLMWAFLAWAGWSAITLGWSRDRGQGIDELLAMRVLLTPLAMWPVLDRLPMHLGAALVGVFAQQVCQLLDFMGWVDFRVQDAEYGRVGGWIHPIHTGTWCVAAICWNLAAALCTRGWMRAVSTGLLLAAAVGLLATQSRGPWLAATIVAPLTLIAIFLRRPDSRRFALILAVLCIGGALIAWPVARKLVTPRLAEAASDVQRAADEEVYWTPIGLRMGLAQWSWQLFTKHPVRGIGVGSFQTALRELPAYQHAEKVARNHNRDFVQRMRRDHPHSMYLYTLTCTGAIGGILMLAVIVLLVRQLWRDPPNHPWALGSMFVLIGWLIGAMFDCHELNGHAFGLMGYLAAATLPHRARIRYDLRPGRPAELALLRAEAAARGEADEPPSR
ncbi:MAG: O-antigen ligase family protein [Phycisphaerales bacterium]|nr:MAG: O-antigen ligase family protein [Phycisphaerales bacterium]